MQNILHNTVSSTTKKCIWATSQIWIWFYNELQRTDLDEALPYLNLIFIQLKLKKDYC